MKKVILSMFVALMATVAVQAQRISVVSDGNTSFYNTFPDAVENAPSGSVIYLPGGVFPFGNANINKKLTIIGIGHNVNGENADGATTISGDFSFGEGSDGSAIVGCYITGTLNIGNSGSSVNDILVKKCNIYYINVGNSNCLRLVINQNYIREGSLFNFAGALFTNNIVHSIKDFYNGTISNNIFTSNFYTGSAHEILYHCYNSTITHNVLLAKPQYISALSGDRNVISGNISRYDFGEESVNIGDTPWSEVFVNPSGVSSVSNYHFKEAFQQYENKCGIYAGTGFDDKGLSPVPYIEFKDIDDKTDAEGKLHINIRVKANN